MTQLSFVLSSPYKGTQYVLLALSGDCQAQASTFEASYGIVAKMGDIVPRDGRQGTAEVDQAF